jgi:hypothetical protein
VFSSKSKPVLLNLLEGIAVGDIVDEHNSSRLFEVFWQSVHKVFSTACKIPQFDGAGHFAPEGTVVVFAQQVEFDFPAAFSS